MVFLKEDELKTYYPAAEKMTENDVKKFLQRANAYAFGIVGGVPPFSDELPEENLKAAVAQAFEILAEGQDAQTNSVNGNITEAAPTGYYTRSADKPLAVVETMLLPYAQAFDKANTTRSEKGIAFL